MYSQARLTDIILEQLSVKAAEIQNTWNNPVGTTTRHFVIDDLLPSDACAEIFHSFPKDGTGFHSRKSFREKKRTSADIFSYPPILAAITFALQSPEVIKKISELTNLKDMEPDPKLYAGGLSMMFKNDYLNPHIDNSHDADRQRYRRLNLLYYATPDWEEAFGGNLELWDADVTRARTIHSRFNRLAVMETNRLSWHSVSPVQVDSVRCCVSNYYFSQQSPEGADYFHVTSFVGRPGENTKRAVAAIDNGVRGIVSRVFNVGTGKGKMNKNIVPDTDN